MKTYWDTIIALLQNTNFIASNIAAYTNLAPLEPILGLTDQSFELAKISKL